MQPFTGRRFIVTRTREQASSLAEGLRALGAEALEIPLIHIEPPTSYAALDAALDRLAEFDALIVTSGNTVKILAERKPPPWPAQPFTVAVGPATAAALRVCGLRVDLQPEPSIAESVLRELVPTARGKRLLLPQASAARDVIVEGLRAAGALVERIEAYRTVPEESSRALLEAAFAQGVDAVTFTSSSTVESLFALLGEECARLSLARTQSCSIGPVTSASLRARGVEPAAEARSYDIDGLLQSIAELFRTGAGSS